MFIWWASSAEHDRGRVAAWKAICTPIHGDERGGPPGTVFPEREIVAADNQRTMVVRVMIARRYAGTMGVATPVARPYIVLDGAGGNPL